MAYYAVDKDGCGHIYSGIPVRNLEEESWHSPGEFAEDLHGALILDISIDWNDPPVEIIAADKNSRYIKVENIGEGDELSVIYGIKDLLTKKVRECLVKFMGEEDVKLVPTTESGNVFALDVPCPFRRFYFKAIIYKDESFNFLGYKEDDLNVPFILGEHDLQDGDLFAILDYLSTEGI